MTSGMASAARGRQHQPPSHAHAGVGGVGVGRGGDPGDRAAAAALAAAAGAPMVGVEGAGKHHRDTLASNLQRVGLQRSASTGCTQVSASAVTSPSTQVTTTADTEAWQAQHRAGGSSLTSLASSELVFVQDNHLEFLLLQELSSDPDRVRAGLAEHFGAVDRGRAGRIHREDALLVLGTTFLSHFGTSTVPPVEEAKWRSWLKRFGVYGPEDTIGLSALSNLYLQAVGQLRDQRASTSFLRSARKVPRGTPRLKDRYDCFEFLSKDSLGKVYGCRDSHSCEARTCKQICKDKAAAPIDHVRRSLSQMRHLVNGHVPRVYEFLEDFHNFYIVTAPAEGMDLMDQVQEAYTQAHPLTEVWVSDIMRQVLEAMAYCHSQPPGPIIHRDLRPENIVLTTATEGPSEEDVAHPHVSISGFGLQVLFDTHNLEAMLPRGCFPANPEVHPLPTSSMPELFAPEVWAHDFGPRCDVWACGCLLFLLLTGTLPFGLRQPLKDLAQQVCYREPDWRRFRHVSTSALSLCRRMLSRSDHARPSASECLRHPWFYSSGNDDRIGKDLHSQILAELMQFHAQTKIFQVLMNIVAAELSVGQLRHIQEVFARADTMRTGLISPELFEGALTELGIPPETVAQASAALARLTSPQVGQTSDTDRQGKIHYALFVAGCADLVEDKLDHMLWKVFSMVDEDHSGEVGVVELDHFLSNALGNTSHEPSQVGDVERYLCGVLDPKVHESGAVERLARGSQLVYFEALKQFVLENALCGKARKAAPTPGASSVRTRGANPDDSPASSCKYSHRPDVAAG